MVKENARTVWVKLPDRQIKDAGGKLLFTVPGRTIKRHKTKHGGVVPSCPALTSSGSDAE